MTEIPVLSSDHQLSNIARSSSPTIAVNITSESMDANGSTYILLAMGTSPENDSIIDIWSASLTKAQRPFSVHVVDDEQDVKMTIADTRVGSRFMICGHERPVAQAVAAARQAGALSDEVLTHITPGGEVTIFCPHCDSNTTTEARPGESVECRKCKRSLVIRPHTSSFTGTYLASVV